jgi:H+/Cl- antiporter ClcA
MDVLANSVAIGAILLAIMLAIFGYRSQQRQQQFFGPPKKKNPWTWGILLFVAMVVGILARYYWELLGKGKTFGDTNTADLLRPLLVSPLVFFPIWAYSVRMPRGLIPVLVAFQNGFFWQTVFEAAKPIR